MERRALKLRYVGTEFCGWQVQKNGVSVQSVLQDAAEAAFGSRPTVTGCSRTDAGVHAKGFVCVMDGIPESVPTDRLPDALNARLPASVVVTAAAKVNPDFHPRYDAKGKEYRYTVRNRRFPDPFTSDYSVCVPTREPLDADALNALCGQFTGTHDFRSFMASGSDVEDTVRTVYDFSCTRNGDELIFSVSADGFLYNMVRILVGTVLDLNAGVLKRTPGEILSACDRAAAGRTMPAKALTLETVFYDSEPAWEEP